MGPVAAPPGPGLSGPSLSGGRVMSKRFVLPAFAVALVCLGGWALAQQAPPAAKQEALGANPPEAPASRYSVSPAGTTAVLLDTASGKTWVLQHSAVGEPVWVPARRLDTADEVRR